MTGKGEEANGTHESRCTVVAGKHRTGRFWVNYSTFSHMPDINGSRVKRQLDDLESFKEKLALQAHKTPTKRTSSQKELE